MGADWLLFDKHSSLFRVSNEDKTIYNNDTTCPRFIMFFSLVLIKRPNKLGHLSGTNTLAYLGSATKIKILFNIDNTCQCYNIFSSALIKMPNKLDHLSGTNALAYLGSATNIKVFFNNDTTCQCYNIFSSH